MSTISKGLQRSKIISQGDTNVPLVSQGLLNVHIHPNVSISISSTHIEVGNSFDIDVSYTLGSTGFNLTYEEQKLICDSQGNNICDDSGDDISSVFESNSSSSISVVVGSEQPVSPSRVVRTLTVTRNSAPIDGLPEKIIINFDNYMAQADITITQTAPPALTLASMTGGGVTGTATSDNTSSSNRNQITPSSSTGTAVLTVSGEIGATYTIQENGDIITGVNKTTVYTIPSGGSNTHNITIAAAGNSERLGAIYPEHTVTLAREQIYFVQPADNVPVLSLTNQNLTDPIQGEDVTGTVNVTSADPGTGTLSILSPSSVSLGDVDVSINSGGSGSYDFTISNPESGTYTFNFTDSGSRLGSASLTLTVTPFSWAGGFASNSWDSETGTVSFSINGLSSAQRNRIDSSFFTLAQLSPSSPTRGTIGTASYNSSTGSLTFPLTNRPPYASISGASESTTWLAGVTVGSFTSSQTSITRKALRPENPLTFPSGNITISDTDTSVTFDVRYDSLTPNIALTDASTTDDDIWTDSELGSATLGGASNPNVSSDVNDVDFYLLQRNVTIAGGSANVTMSALVDMIRVTSS